MEYTQKLRLSYFTFEQSKEAVFWIAGDGTIEHVNPAACRLTGFNGFYFIKTQSFSDLS